MVRIPRSIAVIAAAVLVAPLSAQMPEVAAQQTIQVANFSFTPAAIHLAAGKPVTLTFVNQSNSGHDFTAKEFFAASRISAGAAPDGRVELKPHETQSITLTPGAGAYKAHCSHFMHESMGMHADVMVS